ncbi:cytochrome ubiquinol oxidase subunit I [Arhodomonas sp. AD133]|uniref:cytochrome ubiquinol oxidase subunit I n=1 Tax=Arhodomonas sp. AD133 TaxID=3415009 RepID=UPI003EBDECFC
MELDPVVLSRIQFGLTAMYHFLFVPLTLGLSFILAIMESVYVMTGRRIWREMTQFWGKLFAINFAMGVATGITMEFQFGTNWAYYSHYVGDIFGVPLAIEGLMAFFLESTFVGLMIFGWDRISRLQHLAVTWLVALGSNLSALWILIANGWMQNPVGARFNFETMRMEVTDIFAVIFNPVAQAKFVHTVSAGYVTGAMFVLSISAFYLLRHRHGAFARRSFAVAASFGLASSLSVVVLGDESGYVTTEHQQMKLAAMEAMWETQPAPADFTLVGLPDAEARETHYAVHIPYVLGLIATRSIDEEVHGINELVAGAEQRVRSGLVAYEALQRLREAPGDATARERFEAHGDDLGHALLLKTFMDDPLQAGERDIARAASLTVPPVTALFWTFRIMVALGFFFIALFAFAFYVSATQRFERYRWFLRTAVYALPLPWLAAELGWYTAEGGRQPWAIEGILPTDIAASSVSGGMVLASLIGFVVFYSVLAVVDAYLMVRYARMGPDRALHNTPAGAESVAADLEPQES